MHSSFHWLSFSISDCNTQQLEGSIARLNRILCNENNCKYCKLVGVDFKSATKKNGKVGSACLLLGICRNAFGVILEIVERTCLR